MNRVRSVSRFLFFLPKLTVDQTSAGGSSLVAGERISADFVLPEKTLTSRSAVTKGTCVTGKLYVHFNTRVD